MTTLRKFYAPGFHDPADDDDPNEGQNSQPVTELPWYETLRVFLEPFSPADVKDASDPMTSAEIISILEEHHGVPQGSIGKKIYLFVHFEDFVRAMRYCGYREHNTGGAQLQWLMKKKA